MYPKHGDNSVSTKYIASVILKALLCDGAGIIAVLGGKRWGRR